MKPDLSKIPMSSVLRKNSDNTWVVEHQSYDMQCDVNDVDKRISITTHEIESLYDIPKELLNDGVLIDGIVLSNDQFKVKV
jgi:hypothetical protein